MKDRRIFAIVPAAGRSRRMGEPKLLLPMNDGRSMISHVLSAWSNSLVDHVVVVMRNSDKPLQGVVRDYPVEAVTPERDPPDMKASICCGLSFLQQQYEPADDERWMLAPADMPEMTAELIDAVCDFQFADVRDSQRNLVVPRFGERVGHPISVPFRLNDAVFALGENEGLDSLVGRQSKTYVDLPEAWRPTDVDTPEDYQRRL